jgi:HupE / UreJ protein
MKTLVPLLAVAALPLYAHVMSMSTGDVTVQGNRAHYELRMPVYEIADLKNPEPVLFDHIRFSTAGQDARIAQRSCHADMAQGSYICVADYEFPVAVDRLDVDCTLHQVTVPNHVHLLRAQKDGKSDQAIFDFSFSKAQIRFDPPTAMETFFTQTGAGFVRALGGLVQILFLATLALAARSRRELAALAGMFLLGQVATAVIASKTNWEPAPRFVEAATALTIAYMAVEILALPQAGKRWLIAGALGVFHGLYFALFLRTTEYNPVYVLTGASIAEVLLIGLFAFGFSRIGRVAAGLRPVQVSASVLLAIGMFWFFLRLKS